MKNDQQKKNSCYTKINQIDIVDFLSSIGFTAAKIRGNNFWYLSPLRNEKNPSFKVNRLLNRWYDFGDGKGSTLIDFCMRFYGMTLREIFKKFLGDEKHDFVAQKKLFDEPKAADSISIKKVSTLQSAYLLRYLSDRRISINVAQKCCHEVSFQIGAKNFYAIGFKNDLGGYELRNKYFKGGSAPKSFTLLKSKEQDAVSVFEGFFDFLSFLQIFPEKLTDKNDFLVLNSLSFFESSIPKLKNYSSVHLFLNNDRAGDKATLAAVSQLAGCMDHRELFIGYKDLNDFLCGRKINGIQ